jgi:hypothetical protein
VAASGSSVLVRHWNKKWPHDLKMDGRLRSVDTGLISDLICSVGSRSDGRKKKGRGSHRWARVSSASEGSAARVRTPAGLRWSPVLIGRWTAVCVARGVQGRGWPRRLLPVVTQRGDWRTPGRRRASGDDRELISLRNRWGKVVGETRQVEIKGIEGRRGRAAHRRWWIPPRRPADWRSSDDELFSG